MTRRRMDPVEVVESCYRPASSDAEWLRGVTEALSPLDRGQGLVAFTYQGRAAGRLSPRTLVDVGCDHDWRETTRRLLGEAPPELVRALRGSSPPAGLFSQRLPELGQSAASFVGGLFGAVDVEDLLVVLAAEPRGLGALVAMPVRRGARFASRTVQQLGWISAHILSGQRLRRIARRAVLPADAVLDPAGVVHHAGGGARSREVRGKLVRAVRSVERARGRLRWRDPDGALQLWQGLVDGTWSLVDHEDTDGRRWVLARRNAPEVQDPKALTPRERQVLAFAVLGHSNKYIGYLLGLAPSTVATHLHCVQRKLAVSSRRELIQVFGALPIETPRRGESPSGAHRAQGR